MRNASRHFLSCVFLESINDITSRHSSHLLSLFLSRVVAALFGSGCFLLLPLLGVYLPVCSWEKIASYFPFAVFSMNDYT